MPLRNSLRQPVRQLSGQTRRKPCRTCNNLDPRGHSSSMYNAESEKTPLASLSLVLDALSLAKTKDPKEGGCRFCGVLVQALDAFFENWRGVRQRVCVDLKEKGSIKVGIDGEEWKRELVEIYAGSASRAPWPTLGTAHHIPTDSGSDDTFNFARRCIQDCLVNPKHVACKLPSKSSTSSPKRLLDVGRVTAPIRLIDTQGKSFEYAALSHCWGTGPTLTAKKSNWQKLTSNIPFDALPPLFQDAIVITRQLGLRYIWIDSLCIIQDSVRDWETESAKMGSIYENSYVTISATNSGDGSIRCLADRRKPVKLNYENTTGKEFSLRARLIQDHHPDVQDGEPARLTGRLTTRAWALQEHVLSTRILHYTATELLFECKTSCRCECKPSRKILPTTPALIPKAIAKQSKRRDTIWDAWHRIVEQYSKRDLTVPNDKLPAISGIAHKIKEATESSYFAGVWEHNIASDLLWSTCLTAMPDAHYFSPETYRAPSFSWASLDTPVSFYSPDEDERETFNSSITPMSSSISVTGLNPLGAVADATIQVRGPTIRAVLCSTQKDGMWEYALLIKGTSAIGISHDCLLVADTVATTSEVTQTTARRAHCGDKPFEFKAAVLCLGVARFDSWASGLVLGFSSQGSGLFERLGTFSAGMEAFQRAEDQEIELA
ncbi:HET-domain-containing protein [Lentithecium fluviatile CBS 122367]|uniref:HET-domain-containing protein n=1 Tax=Lentithecium fluviatile CBS 122367 TaxID=1168545 RepID=A0A6G1JKD1_9PLEO|nr:HET-domain-containing protein [Lentithecium fluviatile CBS 122367]